VEGITGVALDIVGAEGVGGTKMFTKVCVPGGAWGGAGVGAGAGDGVGAGVGTGAGAGAGGGV
jgi:hypothetical protein